MRQAGRKAERPWSIATGSQGRGRTLVSALHSMAAVLRGCWRKLPTCAALPLPLRAHARHAARAT